MTSLPFGKVNSGRAKSTQKPLHLGQSQLALAHQLNQRDQPTALQGMPAMPAMHLVPPPPLPLRSLTHARSLSRSAAVSPHPCMECMLPKPLGCSVARPSLTRALLLDHDHAHEDPAEDPWQLRHASAAGPAPGRPPALGSSSLQPPAGNPPSVPRSVLIAWPTCPGDCKRFEPRLAVR